jgi:fatty acid desaturase
MSSVTRAALLRDLMTPSDAYGWRSLMRLVAGVALALAAAPLLAALWTPWAGWLAAPLVGLRVYKLTQVLHDCIHQTLFRRPQTNRRVGAVVGLMTGIDFAAFRRLHLQHHRIYGRADDPQGGDYLGLIGARRHRILFHLLRPLAAAPLVPS